MVYKSDKKVKNKQGEQKRCLSRGKSLWRKKDSIYKKTEDII